MRFITLLSLLTALAAASPISSRRSPNTALAPINKRFEANVPWIWRPKKTDFERFEDEGDEAAPTEINADTNAVINKRNNGPWHWQTSNEVSNTPIDAVINKRNNGPWHWQTSKEVSEKTGEDNTPIDAVISKRNNGPWHWQTSKEVSGEFKDGVDDVAIE